MPVVGEGAYGCVHKPALTCKDKNIDNHDDKISKILSEKHAKVEMEEFQLLSKYDKNETYHLGKPIHCNPELNDENVSEIEKCKHSDNFMKDIDKNKLLIMQDGGPDLHNYLQSLVKTNPLSVIKDQSKIVLQDYLQIIEAVQFFISKSITHRDIKDANIVYNNGVMKVIDFGLMTTFQQVIRDSGNNKYWMGDELWWSISPICINFNRRIYEYIHEDNVSVYIQSYRDNMKTNKNFASFMDIIHNTYVDDKSGYEVFMTGIENLYQNIPHFKFSQFMVKALPCIDMFNIGFTLIDIVKRLKGVLSKTFINEAYRLSFQMMDCNVFEHIKIKEVVTAYKNLLKKHKLDASPTTATLRSKTSISTTNTNTTNTTNNTNNPLFSTMKIPTKTLIQQSKTHCDDSKIRNPITNRCVKKCSPNKSRNSKFKCSVNKTSKKCPKSKELNPFTNRCNKRCHSGYSRNRTFKCIRK